MFCNRFILIETVLVSYYYEIIVQPPRHVAVHEIYEIPNSKHQIPNKSKIPNPNDLNYFDFSGIN